MTVYQWRKTVNCRQESAMEYFPATDPIPLPAPVWLFKILHTATLSLHFLALYFMIGGLVLATWWGIRGRMTRDETLINAAGALSYRVPIIIAFVINLGVPPLLFTQVLYGRALYTSSVLIGAYWIAVIFLIMAGYFLAYNMAYRARGGSAFGWVGLLSLLFLLKVAHIYTNNMTLMLRPEVWGEMYRNSPQGAQLASGDPAIMARWLFMVVTSLGIGGVLLMLLSLRGTVEERAAALLRRRGALLLLVFSLVSLYLGWRVITVQPDAVRAWLANNAFYAGTGYAWAAVTLLLAAIGAAGVLGLVRAPGLLAVAALAAAFLDVALIVLFRDGIRDATLNVAGFDVWDRVIVTNWTVVLLFLVLFVAAVVCTGWMALVTIRGKGEKEQYA
jgi:hypothetical protein